MSRIEHPSYHQHALPAPSGQTKLVEIAQTRVPDVVLAAGLFKPNAGGRHELSLSGFTQRQLLKGKGCYHGERLVVAVTPLDVVTFELGRWWGVRAELRWSRSSMIVRRVATQGSSDDREWPAFRLSGAGGLPAVELVIRHRDENAAAVMQLLGLRSRPAGRQ
jgi:hypothetical protein